jgi:hypothetical protein
VPNVERVPITAGSGAPTSVVTLVRTFIVIAGSEAISIFASPVWRLLKSHLHVD